MKLSIQGLEKVKAYNEMVAAQKRAGKGDKKLQSTLNNLRSLKGGTEVRIADMHKSIDAWVAKMGAEDPDIRATGDINKLFLSFITEDAFAHHFWEEMVF